MKFFARVLVVLVCVCFVSVMSVGQELPAVEVILDRAIEQQGRLGRVSFVSRKRTEFFHDAAMQTMVEVQKATVDLVRYDESYHRIGKYDAYRPDGELFVANRASSTYDGKWRRILNLNFEMPRGYIRSGLSTGDNMSSGEWMITGILYGISEGREEVDEVSYLQHLRDRVATGEVGIRLREGSHSGVVYVVSAEMEWGSCSVEIDASRAYSVVRVVAHVMMPQESRFESITYESGEFELVEVEGLWFPKAVHLKRTDVIRDRPLTIQDIDYALEGIKVLEERPIASVFKIDWPEDTQIRYEHLNERFGLEIEERLSDDPRFWKDGSRVMNVVAESLVGEMAPRFVLELLEGGEVDLASHQGKDVVVLDFWATWCGPCVEALPLLIEVTDAMKEEGVVFYAVNFQEDKALVKKFVEEKGLEMDVLLDADFTVVDKYGVNAIPQTVIIGKDGTVKAVHIGMEGEFGDMLKGELENLVGGKGLIGKGE